MLIKENAQVNQHFITFPVRCIHLGTSTCHTKSKRNVKVNLCNFVLHFLWRAGNVLIIGGVETTVLIFPFRNNHIFASVALFFIRNRVKFNAADERHFIVLQALEIIYNFLMN